MAYLEGVYLHLNEPNDFDTIVVYPLPKDAQERETRVNEIASLMRLGRDRPVSDRAKAALKWWPKVPPEWEESLRFQPADIREMLRLGELMFAGDSCKLADLASSNARPIYRLACKLGYDVGRVGKLFFPMAEREYKRLKLPVGPPEAWRKIAEALTLETQGLGWASSGWRKAIREASAPEGRTCQPGPVSKVVKVSWVPRARRLTKQQECAESLCHQCGIPLEIDPVTQERTATFSISGVPYARRFLGLQWFHGRVDDQSDARRFLEFLAFALRWQSTSVTLPTGELCLSRPHARTFCHVVDCWVSHTGAPDYCATAPPGDCPSHQESRCPCRLVHYYAGFSRGVVDLENNDTLEVPGDMWNILSGEESDDEIDPETDTAWCWECSQEVAPGRWRLDKDAVRRIVSKTLAQNPVNVCPQFDSGRMESWLADLPDEVAYTENGWIGIELELKRLVQEIMKRPLAERDELLARHDELRVHPLRRGLCQGSGLPW